MNLKVKIFIILSFLCLIPLNVFASSNELSESFQTVLYKAKVLEVVEIKSYTESEVQVLEIEIMDGEYEGTITEINNTLTGNGYDIELEAGDYINVTAVANDSEVGFYFYSYDKSNALIILVIIFIVSVLLIGRMKGLKALISLVITISLIIFGLVPLLLLGKDPIILGILTCLLATILTFVITNGFTKKTFIAIIGVTGGLIIAGFLAYFFTSLCNITGAVSESEQMLEYIPGSISFNYKGLLFAGIIIGALGACMDVAMELTSSLTEIKKHHPKIHDKELIKSGFNIGKDIMGTMVNTLILAYTGGSLSTILLFIGFEKSFNQIVNLDSIATEIIRAIAGSMGLLFAIPVTIFAFVLLNKKGGKIHEKIK